MSRRPLTGGQKLISRGAADAFADVFGARRGSARATRSSRRPSALERARVLAPLVAGALTGPFRLEAGLALNRQAAALDVEVVQVRMVDRLGDEIELGAAALLLNSFELLGFVELDGEGCARLFRPDVALEASR